MVSHLADFKVTNWSEAYRIVSLDRLARHVCLCREIRHIYDGRVEVTGSDEDGASNEDRVGKAMDAGWPSLGFGPLCPRLRRARW